MLRSSPFACCSHVLSLEYASLAIATIYSVPPEALLSDVRHWAALIALSSPNEKPAANGSFVRHSKDCPKNGSRA